VVLLKSKRMREKKEANICLQEHKTTVVPSFIKSVTVYVYKIDVCVCAKDVVMITIKRRE
jgi:hypothetical protein